VPGSTDARAPRAATWPVAATGAGSRAARGTAGVGPRRAPPPGAIGRARNYPVDEWIFRRRILRDTDHGDTDSG
jgi:hypothetical protein